MRIARLPVGSTRAEHLGRQKARGAETVDTLGHLRHHLMIRELPHGLEAMKMG